MQFDQKRRDFITLLGGAAAAWPLAVRVQQGEQMRRVGVLMKVGACTGRSAGFSPYRMRLTYDAARRKQNPEIVDTLEPSA